MSEDVLPYGADRGASPLIRNCLFAFRCKQQWDTLTVTEDPRKRFCGECQRHVVLCERDQDLREALRQNHCVAIPAAVLAIGRDIEHFGRRVVGQVNTPGYGE